MCLNIVDVLIEVDRRKRIGEISSHNWENPTYRNKVLDHPNTIITQISNGYKSKGRKGKPHVVSQATRDKIKHGNTGKVRTLEFKLHLSTIRSGENHSMFGKHPTDATRCKMRNTKLGKALPEQHRLHLPRGKDHMFWKGGISYLPYCFRFNKRRKEATRKFFGYRCLICGKHQTENIVGNREISLSIHHVYHNRDEGCNGIPFNLVPLCHLCHGYENTNEEEYRRYLLKTLEDGFSFGIWSREQYEKLVMYPE